MGVRRKGQYIMDNLAELRLHGGDVLLVQGTWENISRLNRDEEDWVVLGQPLEEAEKVTLDYNTALAISNLFGYFKNIRKKLKDGDVTAIEDINAIRENYDILGLFRADAKEFLKKYDKAGAYTPIPLRCNLSVAQMAFQMPFAPLSRFIYRRISAFFLRFVAS